MNRDKQEGRFVNLSRGLDTLYPFDLEPENIGFNPALQSSIARYMQMPWLLQLKCMEMNELQ